MVAKFWGVFLTDHLKKNTNINYVLVLIVDKDQTDWTRRIAEINKNYAGIRNYTQFTVNGGHTVEFLVVDEKEVYYTFPSTADVVESTGVIVRDEGVCKELCNYCLNFEHKLTPDKLISGELKV